MLTVENITKSYGDKYLFGQLHFTITERDRIGLIGMNGTGKSSLLKIIAGLDQADEGEVMFPHQYRIEYLAQEPQLDDHLTVLDEVYYGEATVMKVLRNYERVLQNLQTDASNEKVQQQLLAMQEKMDEHEAWEANTQAKTILTKLGITQFNQLIGELSGGQRKRVALAKALIQPAQLLILDEPTNHLDHEVIEWLEQYLSTYNGALVLVTHDRYFLNRVTNRIFELDHGQLYTYEGNYELFLEQKAEREATEARSEEKHRNLMRRELAWLQRGPRARGTKQKARIERIEELRNKRFMTDEHNVEIKVGAKRLGTQVIELTDIEHSFGSNKLIAQFNLLIKRGDRIGIIGANGLGKSTLLNIMANRLKPNAGVVEIGETVHIGYYTQNKEEMDESLRVIEYIKKVAQEIRTRDGQVITAEQMLEQFLFSRSEQWTHIHRLSGGEKRRLYLLQVLMTEPNVLFLDEPTNDLDTQTLTILEQYLEHFPGVVITVSHDRYFLDRVVDQLLIFTGGGQVEAYYGNYSEYEIYLKTEVPLENVRIDHGNTKVVEKKRKRMRLSYLDQQEWNTIENDITKLEEKKHMLQEQINEVGSDFEKAQQLYDEQQVIEKKLTEKMLRWEELSLLVEEIEKNK